MNINIKQNPTSEILDPIVTTRFVWRILLYLNISQSAQKHTEHNNIIYTLFEISCNVNLSVFFRNTDKNMDNEEHSTGWLYSSLKFNDNTVSDIHRNGCITYIFPCLTAEQEDMMARFNAPDNNLISQN